MKADALRGALDGVGLGTFAESSAWPVLSRGVVARAYRAGAVLWLAGSPSRGLFVVLTGRIRVVRARQGRQHLVHVAGPGATMGEIAIFGGDAYPATAICAADSECLVFPRASVLAATEADPELLRLFVERMAHRVRTLVERLEAHTLAGVRSRIAAALIGMSEEQSSLTVVVPGSRAMWAEDLGTVREALARELSRMAADGMIERVGRRRIRLLDELALERLAVGEAP